MSSEEIGRSKFNSMIGLAHHERVDEALYDDFETAKAREVRLFICSAFVESLVLVFACDMVRLHKEKFFVIQ